MGSSFRGRRAGLQRGVCSGSSHNITSVHHTACDEILFASICRNALSASEERLATLHDKHVFVIISTCSAETASSEQVQKVICPPFFPSKTQPSMPSVA